jgi:hypothetical protein
MEKSPMKVTPAAQVFSESVAEAIDFSRLDLKMEAFAGSAATSDFIRKINQWFDICNSRHPMQKYTRLLSDQGIWQKLSLF